MEFEGPGVADGNEKREFTTWKVNLERPEPRQAPSKKVFRMQKLEFKSQKVVSEYKNWIQISQIING